MTYARQILFATIVIAGVFVCSQAFAIGLLIPNNTSVRPFDIESHRVDVTVTNNAAVTKVEQVFRNHTNRPMEAQFVFPVPRGATVSDFSLWINGEKTRGAVLDRKQARQIYEDIVRRVRDPGLVEYMDGRLFKASIFPIPPGGTQKLELKFGQVLEKRGGMYRYTYPIAAGREYVTAKTEKDFTLTVTAQSPMPITTAYSPTHKVSTAHQSDNKVVVGTEELQAELDRDFELYLGYSKSDVGINVMTWDADGEGGENGYFMMAIAPRFEAKAHDEIGQTYTFVMDTSGSMNGEKIEQARETLAYCLEKLDPQDHFNVVRFSTTVEQLFRSPQRATKEAREQGVAFARSLEAAGGTAIEPALESALSQTVPDEQPHQVIFVTDGIPTVGATEPDEILADAKSKLSAKDRLFTFGVGFDVNTRLLDGLANHGRGRSDYVKPDESMEEPVSALYSRISAPVLSNIEVDFGGARPYDVYPNPMPDLFRGDQIVLFGRHRDGFSRAIKVTGDAGHEKQSFTFGGGSSKESETERASPDDFDTAPMEFIPKLWATRKVGFLLEQIRLNGEQPELEKEVTRLGKKFGLVTPYTSYLAVDDSEFDDRRVRNPRRPRPRAEFEPKDESVADLGSAMGGSGRSASSETRRRRAPKPRPTTDSFGAMEEETGEGAVRASERTRELKSANKVDRDSGARTRFVAGETFRFEDGAWVQEGLERGADAKEVQPYSEDYFSLLREHNQFKKFAQLGGAVLFEFDGRVYLLAGDE
ncbi:MAG: VIT domain-containing protein [Myxococcota bacterium]